MSTSSHNPLVSVIVAAHNAAATLAETLDSLLAQTSADWEAVIVDDGSSDATGKIAHAYAIRSPRIRVITQLQAGEGGARNTGIAHARGDWLLFLDADDWIAPVAIERYVAVTSANIDAVLAGWVRVTADGTMMRDQFRPNAADLFPTLARLCPFAIHACLVRKSVVSAVGGFEPTLAVGADWDLWQRVARAGARIATVDEILAFYRVRLQSAAVNVPNLIEAGRRLIALGHGPDPRVKEPVPRYVAGMPPEQMASALLSFICWPAGILVGAGGDAAAIVASVGDATDLEIEPSAVAYSIYLAALLPASRPPSAWPEMWTSAEPRVAAFLAALEHQSGTRDLARRTKRALERLVIAQCDERHQQVVGATFSVPVELTTPVVDVAADAGIELLFAQLFFEGEAIGTVELPVCDGFVPGAVLADAVTDHFSWSILGRFFNRHVYPALEIRVTDNGAEVWREGISLASLLPLDEAQRAAVLHDAIGWTVFLQEIWGERSRPRDWFYDLNGDAEREPPDGDQPDGNSVEDSIEVSVPLTTQRVDGACVHVEFCVGGAPVTRVEVPVEQGVVHAAAVRARCTADAGYEMCRIAVREGILGTPLSTPGTLRERVAAAAARVQRPRVLATAVPAWVTALGDSEATLLCTRRVGPVGTSVSRRAVLPIAAATALREAAAAAGEATVGASDSVARVVYTPEVFGTSTTSKVCVQDQHNDVITVVNETDSYTGGFDQHYFETVFASDRDPWSYATPYEQLKYDQTIALIVEAGKTGRILELACAEGMLTEQLAPHAGELLATDIAQIAVDRTAARCAHLENVKVQRLDIIIDPIPTGYDTIVCSEVLYYVGGRDAVAAVAQKLTAALAVGGCIVTTHSNVVVDDPTSPGLDWDVPIGAKGIGEVFATIPGLRYRKEVRTPLYRIQLFERVSTARATLDRFRSADHRTRPTQVVDAPWVQPAPHVAARFLMQGGQPRKGGLPTTATHELPILMYHSVSPEAWPAFARYRITPAAFEEQLRYLRAARFRSVTLEEWRAAKLMWTPLPGRAVLLTFDDGFRDFAEYAWPLLQQYGFGASVFLVTDHMGGANTWDVAYGNQGPLLDWDTVRRLRNEGVEFGSHTATHPFLTARTPADVTRELARSRAALCRELGTPPAALAYPHGAENPAVQHLAGATGYLYGLSTRPGRSKLTDPLLALSRIEVRGTDGLHTFITNLG